MNQIHSTTQAHRVKSQLLSAVFLLAWAVSAHAAITVLPQPEAAGGKPVLLNQKDASALCAKSGKRIPTPMEFAEWSVQHGAGIEASKFPGFVPRSGGQRPAMNTEVIAMLNKKFHPVYKERSDKGDTTEFYFKAQGFVYPANQKPMQIGVWAAEQRTLDSGNKFYGFGPQEAYFSTNTGEEKLGVICIK